MRTEHFLFFCFNGKLQEVSFILMLTVLPRLDVIRKKVFQFVPDFTASCILSNIWV